MHVAAVGVQRKDGMTVLQSRITSPRLGSQSLWFSVPDEYAAWLCASRLDAFLVAMLYPAMMYGEDLILEGPVSQTLLFNVRNFVIPLLRTYCDDLQAISVTATSTDDTHLGGAGVGTGFSAGVDSFSVIQDRYFEEHSPAFRINTLTLFNCGSHGSHGQNDFLRSAQLFRQRYDLLRAFPDEVGLPFVPVDSNVHEFHLWGHQRTHSLTSMSCVLALQSHFRLYYYASCQDYREWLDNASRYKNFDVSEYCDPALLPLLSTESCRLLGDGVQYKRTEKTARIMSLEPTRRFLNVCANNTHSPENCSICNKCCRTLMTLDSLGVTGEFGQVFDIPRYRREAEREFVMRQLAMAGREAFARDNVDFARQRGHALPGRAARAKYAVRQLVGRYATRDLPLRAVRRLGREMRAAVGTVGRCLRS
jgi:hypothetical protein